LTASLLQTGVFQSVWMPPYQHVLRYLWHTALESTLAPLWTSSLLCRESSEVFQGLWLQTPFISRSRSRAPVSSSEELATMMSSTYTNMYIVCPFLRKSNKSVFALDGLNPRLCNFVLNRECQAHGACLIP
jgi:hypothetical protein